MNRYYASCAAIALALAFSAPEIALAESNSTAEQAETIDFTGLWVVSNRTLRGNRDENFEKLEAEDYLTERALEATKNVRPALDPGAMCLPSMPRHLGGPYPIEIIQNDDRVVQLFEWENIFRIIYTDDTEHPDPEVERRYMGHAVGKWEDGMLRVETTNFNGKAWLSGDGIPMSKQAKLTEWYRLTEGGETLEVVMKYEDDVNMTRPIWRKYFFNLKNEWDIKEYLCAEGNRDNVFQQKEGLPGSLELDDVLPED